MTPTERTAKFCKVYLGHRNTLILENWTIARDSKGQEIVTGTSVGSGRKQLFRVDGMRVVPLAANCEGELVPLRHACHCTPTMARAVEKSYAWDGKPQYITNPKPVSSQTVKSFSELRKAMAQIGGAR